MDAKYFTTLDSPIGEILLAGSDDHLTNLVFLGGKKAKHPETSWRASRAPFREAIRQLEAYFAGELREFELPVAPDPPGTTFQDRVWNAMRRIPYGVTISYGELARRIGKPNSARAVGAASGQNRVPVVIPCHRVVGSSGGLTGYGGGLAIKEKLLGLEGRDGSHIAR